MSLRDDAITHMAQALARRWQAARPGPDPSPTSMADAEAALTALLDFLGAHTEEWHDAAYDIGDHPGSGTWTEDLVAALRGTTEEGET